MAKKSLQVAKSKVRPPASREELIDAMVELKRKQFEQELEATRAKEDLLVTAFDESTIRFIRLNINQLEIKASINYMGEITASLVISNSLKGYPAAQLKALKDHRENIRHGIQFDSRSCRENIKEAIKQERIKLILADKILADSLTSALMRIGSVAI